MIISETQLREEKFLESIPVPSGLNSLYNTIDQAALFMERSLVLVDLSFHVIAYSRTVPITDPIWIKNIERKYCTYEFIRAVSDLIPDEMINGSMEAHFINCSASEENKLCVTLFVDKNPIGYLILLDNSKGIMPYHLQYLPRLAQMISSNLQNLPDFYPLFIDKTEEYLAGLLEHSKNLEVSKEFTERHPEPAGMKLPNDMRCLVVVPASRSQHDLFYLRREFRNAFPSGFYFIYDKRLVAIISDAVLQNFKDSLPKDPYMKVVKKIGVSNSFQSLRHFPRQHQYAEKAIELCAHLGEDEKLCIYKHVEVYNILNHVQDRRILKDFMHPCFEILHAYDLDHDSDLLETLKVYLTRGLNSKETAAVMFLHRNTLNYRLSKIKELTGLTFEDPEENFRLIFSMHIHNYL